MTAWPTDWEKLQLKFATKKLWKKKKFTCQIQGSKKWSPFIPNSHLTSPPASHSSPSFQSRFFFWFLVGSAQRLDPRQCKSTWEKKKHHEEKKHFFDFSVWSCYHPPVVSITWNFWEPRSNLVSSIWQVGNLGGPKNKMGFAAIPQGHFAEVSRWNHTAKSHGPRVLGEHSNSVVSLALIAQLQMSKSLGLRRFTSFLRVYSSNSPKNDHHNPMFCLMSRCRGLKNKNHINHPQKPWNQRVIFFDGWCLGQSTLTYPNSNVQRHKITDLLCQFSGFSYIPRKRPMTWAIEVNPLWFQGGLHWILATCYIPFKKYVSVEISSQKSFETISMFFPYNGGRFFTSMILLEENQWVGTYSRI